MNCDVGTHDTKMRIAISNFLSKISREYQNRPYFSFKNIPFAPLKQKRERREPIRFRAYLKKY